MEEAGGLWTSASLGSPRPDLLLHGLPCPWQDRRRLLCSGGLLRTKAPATGTLNAGDLQKIDPVCEGWNYLEGQDLPVAGWWNMGALCVLHSTPRFLDSQESLKPAQESDVIFLTPQDIYVFTYLIRLLTISGIELKASCLLYRHSTT